MSHQGQTKRGDRCSAAGLHMTLKSPANRQLLVDEHSRTPSARITLLRFPLILWRDFVVLAGGIAMHRWRNRVDSTGIAPLGIKSLEIAALFPFLPLQQVHHKLQRLTLSQGFLAALIDFYLLLIAHIFGI